MNILEVIKVKSGRPILFVEDDHVDAMAVERIFKEIGIPNKLYVANNGEEALILLKEEGREKPCFVLLDLNMPRMNG
ncbi:MAG: response regulator, partial [Candidatus Hodarchaeota archaeon]